MWLGRLRTRHSAHEDMGSIPDLIQQFKDLVFIGCRCSLDPMLPWLWHRLAAAVLIQPLAQELPYAASAFVKRKHKKRTKQKKQHCPPMQVQGLATRNERVTDK